MVLGGIRSGKSAWAESAITQTLAMCDTVRYVATGRHPGIDPGWEQRVTAHRQRRPQGWSTAETTGVAAELRENPATPILVDDLGGWLTATLDERGWDDGSVADDVEDLVSAVESFTAPLVLVSPEVGLTVVPATSAGRRFADELGTLNQRLAAVCERVALVIAGQPMWVKE